jgi:hypothetical protein
LLSRPTLVVSARFIGGVRRANAFSAEGVKSQFGIDAAARILQLEIDERLQTSASRYGSTKRAIAAIKQFQLL